MTKANGNGQMTREKNVSAEAKPLDTTVGHKPLLRITFNIIQKLRATRLGQDWKEVTTHSVKKRSFFINNITTNSAYY